MLIYPWPPVFDQQRKLTDDEHRLEIDLNSGNNDPLITKIYRCLNQVQSDPEIEAAMTLEDLFLAEQQDAIETERRLLKEAEARLQEAEAKVKAAEAKAKTMELEAKAMEREAKELEAENQQLKKLLSGQEIPPSKSKDS